MNQLEADIGQLTHTESNNNSESVDGKQPVKVERKPSRDTTKAPLMDIIDDLLKEA